MLQLFIHACLTRGCKTSRGFPRQVGKPCLEEPSFHFITAGLWLQKMRLGRQEAVPLLEKLWDKLVDNMLEGHRKPGFISSVKDEMKTGKKKKGELAHTEVLIASSA